MPRFSISPWPDHNYHDPKQYVVLPFCLIIHAMKDNPLTELVEALQSHNENLQLQNVELAAKVAWYEEQFRLSQHKRFGASSEQDKEQGQLFNEAEAVADEEPVDDEPGQTVSGHTRKKPVRRSLSENDKLPRTIEIVDLPECEKQCNCGRQCFNTGEAVSYKLKIEPAKASVIELRRQKYGCLCEDGIKIAPLPASPIPKSIATPELLAWVITSKYCDALPLYRQGFILNRMGVDISRATLADWMIKCSDLLECLYDALKKQLVKQPALQVDETAVQVLGEPDRSPQSKSYMWLYRTTAMLDNPVILYDYQTGRGHENPEAFLKGFAGYLQCDGYSAYKTLSSKVADIELVGCMAHLRRKFKEALDAMPKNKHQPNKVTRAGHVIGMIKKLYAIEKRIKEKPTDERYRIRQKDSKPILDQLKAWLDKNQPLILPKGLLGKAITYAQNQWPYIIRYLDDGLLDIDNNAAERAIKPFVIGRKNWLFAQSVKGARASAILYSIVETAKANGLEPYARLRHALAKIPKLEKGESIDHLLPIKITSEEAKTAA